MFSPAKCFPFLSDSWWERGNAASLQINSFFCVSAMRQQELRSERDRLTPAWRLAWWRQPGWPQLSAIPFPFHFGSLCAHGELLWLSCHCWLAIITWSLSQSPVHGNVSDSPVPNLVLVGNTSSWGGLQYVVHGLSWFVSWDAVERSSQMMLK